MNQMDFLESRASFFESRPNADLYTNGRCLYVIGREGRQVHGIEDLDIFHDPGEIMVFKGTWAGLPGYWPKDKRTDPPIVWDEDDPDGKVIFDRARRLTMTIRTKEGDPLLDQMIREDPWDGIPASVLIVIPHVRVAIGMSRITVVEQSRDLGIDGDGRTEYAAMAFGDWKVVHNYENEPDPIRGLIS